MCVQPNATCLSYETYIGEWKLLQGVVYSIKAGHTQSATQIKYATPTTAILTKRKKENEKLNFEEMLLQLCKTFF